jgi:hypothetical protein
MAAESAAYAALEAVLGDGQLMADVARCRQRIVVGGINVGLSGIDGAGKSTLSEQLKTVFTAAGVAVERLHVFAWHQNLLAMPATIRSNRRRGGRVLIFDRTIHDNVGKFFAARPGIGVLLPVSSWVTCRCLPDFDYLFYLHASFETIRARRPDTTSNMYARLTATYRVITGNSGHLVVQSDEQSLRTVLGHLVVPSARRSRSH